MKYAILAAALGLLTSLGSAQAGCPGGCGSGSPYPPLYSTNVAWHNGFYDPSVGVPMALVVPPTAQYQVNYGWGVGGTRVSAVYPQFGRPYPGPGGNFTGFAPTPFWPSDTQQFGVYYVRGPWGTYR